MISPNQASFARGCQSCNNFIVCQEIVHSMRYTTAKHGGMILKLDLEKAYDRLQWIFVEETLIDIGIPGKIVRVIWSQLQRSTCTLLWNGEAIERITPTKGL